MNNIFWDIFEASVSVFEAFVIIRFACAFLKYDFRYKHRNLIVAAGAFGFCVLASIVNYYFSYNSALGFVYVIYLFLFSYLFLNGKLGAKFFASVAANAAVLGTNISVVSIYAAATGCSAEYIYTQPTTDRMIVLIIVQALRAYAFELILRVTKRNELELNTNEWALVISVPAISFVLMWLIQSVLVSPEISESSSGNPSMVLFIAQLGIIVINVVCVYATMLLNKNRIKAEKLALQRRQEELKAQYVENVRSRYEEMRRIRHDLKQSYTVIGELLNAGKNDEAIEFIRKNQSAISDTEVIIDVGNDFVNAILNSKLSLARQNGIEVICSSTKNIAGINETDLCNLLGNLLDNAIEAAAKCEESQRLLEVDIAAADGRIVITCSNSVESPVDFLPKRSGEHGIGIVSIKHIVKSYNGSVNYFEEDGFLTCKVVVYGNEQTDR